MCTSCRDGGKPGIWDTTWFFSAEGHNLAVVAGLIVDRILGLNFLRPNNCRLELPKISPLVTNARIRVAVSELLFAYTTCEWNCDTKYYQMQGKLKRYKYFKNLHKELCEQFQGYSLMNSLVDGRPENTSGNAIDELAKQGYTFGKRYIYCWHESHR